MFDLQKLRYFIVVAKYENVARAAAELNITQSPLSRQIMLLEGQLGFPLFKRQKKRLSLTNEGRAFLKEATHLVEEENRLRHKAHAIASGASGTIVIGYVDGAIYSGVLGRALQSFRELVPNAEIELKLLRSFQQFQELASGTLDIGLTYSMPPQNFQLSSQHIWSEGFKLAAPKEKGMKEVALACELDQAPFIALPEGDFAIARQEMIEACAESGFNPDIRFEAANPLATLEMVNAGLGFAFVQESLNRIKPGGVDFISPPAGFKYDMKLTAVHAEHLPVLVQRFMDSIDVNRSS